MSTDAIGVQPAPHTPVPHVDTPPAYTVRVKPCCQVLKSDFCDCAAFAAQARGLFAPGKALFWDLRDRKATS